MERLHKKGEMFGEVGTEGGMSGRKKEEEGGGALLDAVWLLILV